MTAMPVPTAAIVVIGDEILSGKFPEDNAAWLLKELRDLGVALRHIQVIPDVVDEIRDAVRADAAASTTCSPPAASGRRTTT
jgi:molybdopterin-biosynthesis enzyme MoeA-like protein